MMDEEYDYTSPENWVEITIQIPKDDYSEEFSEQPCVLWRESIQCIHPSISKDSGAIKGCVVYLENGETFFCINDYNDLLLRLGLLDFIKS